MGDFYTKDLPSGTSLLIVYDGANLDAINTMLASISSTDMRFKDGELFVFGEFIRVGDAVRLSDDGSPVPLAKINREDLASDEYRIEALAYEGNLDEVMVFVGRDAHFTGDELYVKGVLVEDTDFVYKVYGGVKGKATATRIGDDYTIES